MDPLFAQLVLAICMGIALGNAVDTMLEPVWDRLAGMLDVALWKYGRWSAR